jgi:type IV pilus assembly protein PilM
LEKIAVARKEPAVGLDIGRHSIKAVWAKFSGGKPYVTRAEILRLPSETADVAGLVSSWIENIGLTKKRCVIGVPALQTMFHPLLFQKEDPRTDDQAVEIEVLKFNELAHESMNYGYVPIDTGDEARRVLLVLARPSVLDEVLSMPQRLGVEVVDVVPAPFAFFNVLSRQFSSETSPILFIYIGHSSTEIAIGFRNSLLFARAFSCGGAMFTDAVARALKLPWAQAENLKLKEGSLKGDKPYTRFLTTVADTWISSLASALSVYRSVFSEQSFQPSRAVLCGGGAYLDGFAEYISQKLNIPVDVVAGFTTSRRVELDNPAVFTVAAGLSLTTSVESVPVVSLLPEAMYNELMFKRQKPFWIAAGITASMILSVSLWGGHIEFKRNELALEQQKRKLSELQKLRDEIENLKAETDKVKGISEPIILTARFTASLYQFINLLGKVKTESDWITLITDAQSYMNRRPATTVRRGVRDVRRDTATAKEPNWLPKRTIIVEGYTSKYNFSTVDSLIRELKQAPFVASADLLSDDRIAQETPQLTPKRGGLKRFVLAVELR